jgi:hypothetical protein
MPPRKSGIFFLKKNFTVNDSFSEKFPHSLAAG